MFAICEQVENCSIHRLFGRLRENLRNNFFQRRVFDADVFQGVVREYGREDLRDLLAIDAELYSRLGDFYDFALAS